MIDFVTSRTRWPEYNNDLTMRSSTSQEIMLASGSSISSRTMSDDTPNHSVQENFFDDENESCTAPSNTVYPTVSLVQPPRARGRKGHTKSRAGCLNCKKARIKVQYSILKIQITITEVSLAESLLFSARKISLRATTVPIGI